MLLWAGSCVLESAIAATVQVTWSQPTGKTATNLSYGLNVFQAFDPNVAGTPGNAIYKSNVESMRPGIIRYHNMQMMRDSTLDPYGWLIAPNTAQYQWDRTKIANAFNTAYSFRPVVMMSIPTWASFLDDGTGRLKPGQEQAFAAFCADLVRIINVDLNQGVKYWEVTNEKDGVYGANMAELGRIYTIAAQAMKQVDPTIKVGGPAFTNVYDTVKLESFLSVAHPALDFVSYHTYSTGSKTNPVTDLYKSASQLTDPTGRVKRGIAKFTTRSIETFHDEFNISYAPITNAGATGSMAWNESDGWYGKLENRFGNWSRRPASYVYQLFNTHLQGPIVTSNSSDTNAIISFAVKNAGKSSIALVNRSTVEQIVPVTFSGWDTPITNSELLTAYSIGSAGYITTAVTLPELSQGYKIPADTVVVITRSQPL
jgi:Glycosyl hydrolases family 39